MKPRGPVCPVSAVIAEERLQDGGNVETSSRRLLCGASLLTVVPLSRESWRGTGAGARGSSQGGQYQKNQKAKTHPALLGALKVKLEGLFGHLTQGLGEGPERGEGVKGVRGQGIP